MLEGQRETREATEFVMVELGWRVQEECQRLSWQWARCTRSGCSHLAKGASYCTSARQQLSCVGTTWSTRCSRVGVGRGGLNAFERDELGFDSLG